MNTQALFGQLLIGLINGSFYALLSLGLAVIFGLLNIINFTHGAQYMIGAFVAFFLLEPIDASGAAGDVVAALGIGLAYLVSLGGLLPTIKQLVAGDFAHLASEIAGL